MQDQQKYTGGLAKTRVLIVGGTVGIGYGVAEAALEHGVSAVSISSSQQSRVNCAVSSLEGSYPSAKGKIKGYVCDLSTEETLEENVRGLLKNVGKIDHLVYTTGDRLWTMPIDETDFAKLKQAGLIRFFAPYLFARYAYTEGNLERTPASSIILTTGSISQPKRNWSLPASWAGGLHSLARNLAVDLAPIRVNLVSLGRAEAKLWDWIGDEAEEKLLDKAVRRLLTLKFDQVKDVTHAYLYLMQNQNATASIVDSSAGNLYTD